MPETDWTPEQAARTALNALATRLGGEHGNPGAFIELYRELTKDPHDATPDETWIQIEAKLEERLEAIEARLDSLETKVNTGEQVVGVLTQRLVAVEENVADILSQHAIKAQA